MLRDDQIRRYSRHVLLPDVGGVGQKRILAATVEVPDAGGAAGAAIAYLAAAGVGTLIIADAEVVLPGDVGALYESADIGLPRAQAAATRVAALNPDVTVLGDRIPRPNPASPNRNSPIARNSQTCAVPPISLVVSDSYPPGSCPLGVGAAAAAGVLRAILAGGAS